MNPLSVTSVTSCKNSGSVSVSGSVTSCLINALFPMHTTITALRDPLYHFLHELWSQVDDSGYGCPHLALDDFELQLVNDLLSSPRPLTEAQREEVTKLQTRCEPHLHCPCVVAHVWVGVPPRCSICGKRPDRDNDFPCVPSPDRGTSRPAATTK
jgi:hypothetical protein